MGRKRGGRAGCLGSLLGLVVLGLAASSLIAAIFAPWGFFLGGRFHPVPGWRGWAVLHSAAAGGDYRLYIRMTPAPSPAPHAASGLRGDAFLCTPRGERFNLTLSGGMPRSLFNDFERVILPRHPGAPPLKDRMTALGASSVLMSGSGPAVFGLFPALSDARSARDALLAEGIPAWAAKPL